MNAMKKCYIKDCDLPCLPHGVYCKFHQNRRHNFGDKSAFTHVRKNGDIRTVRVERKIDRKGII